MFALSFLVCAASSGSSGPVLLDTAAKRRAAAGTPFLPVFNVTPNAAKDTSWRRQVAWSYL